MNCYFKSIDTFLTYGQAVVHEYEVPIMTADGTHGTVTVTGELSQDYTGDWLVLDGHLLYIVSVAPGNNMTSIVVGDPFTAFSRTVAYVEPSSYYLGEYIKEFAESEYINQPDPFFDMPYLTVTNSDTTEFAHVAPNDGLTSLEMVIRNAMERGVVIAVSFDEDSLTLAVSTGTTTRQTVVLGDGHSELVEETYNRELISKVTVISELGYPHYYYKTLTGEITTTPPVNRPRGEWVTVQQGADNLLDTAKEAFAASIDSHRITFYSTLELSLSQPLRVRLKDKTYETAVTYIGIQTHDNRFMYQCGEAISTLTGRVASIGRAVAQAVSSIPTAVSQLQNDAGYVDAAGAADAAPVQSVNSQTGAVTVAVPTKTSELNNDSGYITAASAVAPTNQYVCAGGTGPMGYGFFNNATAARIFVPMPNNASGITAVTYSGTLELYFGSGLHQAITGMSVVGVQPGGVIVAVTIASGGTQRMPCILEGEANSTITATLS